MNRKFKLLFVSDSIWLPTGYGKVSKYLVSFLKKDFDVIFLSVTDPTLGSIKIGEIECFRYVRNELDLLWFYTNFKVDIVLLLKEPWVLPNIDKIPIHYILYSPYTQCEPPKDYLYYASLAIDTWLPSKYETEQVKKYGIDATYMPHGVDTKIFKPLDNIKELKKKYGFDRFDIVIGLFGMNTLRKVLPNQLEGIKVFIDNNPDIKVGIYLHSTLLPIKEYWNGYDLRKIIEKFELDENVIIPNQSALLIGFSDYSLAELYNCCDVVVDTCYEGFGLHILEAQACGTPVVTLSIGGGSEINFLDLRVSKFAKFYTQLGSYFAIPDPYEIAEKIEKALKYRKESIREYLHTKASVFEWFKIYKYYVKPRLDYILENLYYRKLRRGKKVAIVTSWGYRCGIASFVKKLLHGFNQHDIYIIPIPTFRNCNYDEYINYLVDKIKVINPDIVLIELEHGVFGRESTSFEQKFYTKLRNELQNVKIVTDFHVVDVYKGIEVFNTISSNSVIVHNKAMFEKLIELIKEYGYEYRNINVISLCSNKIEISKEDARKELGIEKDCKLIGIFGFISPRKGIDIFFKVVEELKREIPNLKGVIVGGFHAETETSYIKYVKKKAKELNIIITGFVNDDIYFKYLKAVDVVLYPCFMLSASGIVIDCIVNNVPIIVLDSPAFKDLPILKAKSIDDFIEFTKTLLSNPKVYNMYVSKLIELSKEFDCKKIAELYSDIFVNDDITTMDIIDCFNEWLERKKEKIIGNSVHIDFKEIAHFCSEKLGKEVKVQKVVYVIRRVLGIENDWIKVK